MSHIGRILAEMGALPPNAVREMQKWKNPAVEGINPETIPEEPADINVVVSRLDEAFQSKDAVEVKETDLSILEQYIQTRTEALLHLEDDEGQGADVPVEVGRLRTGEFIFPWTSEGIEDVMTNGRTELRFDGATEGMTFTNVRELFYGENKAFMVCTPARLGVLHGRS